MKNFLRKSGYVALFALFVLPALALSCVIAGWYGVGCLIATLSVSKALDAVAETYHSLRCALT